MNSTQEELLQTRQILLSWKITGGDDDYVRDALLLLNNRSPEQPIVLWIDSPGGSAHIGLSIYDKIRVSQAPVYGFIPCRAASAALLILQGCKQRFLLQHSRVRLHGVASIEVDSLELLEDEEKALQGLRQLHNMIFGVYSEMTGRSLEELYKIARLDRDLIANEAVELGFADGVVASREEFLELLAQSSTT